MPHASLCLVPRAWSVARAWPRCCRCRSRRCRPRLQGSLKLDMYSLAYLAYSSPLQGGALYTDGEVGDLWYQHATYLSAIQRSIACQVPTQLMPGTLW